MKQKPLPSWEYLNECFHYNPETGLLTWKIRPRWHFKDERMFKSWNTLHSGNSISCTARNGYLMLTLDSKNHYAHRIVYKLVAKKDPDHHIDHANGVKTDNRWINLREASHSDNMRNRGAHRDSASGHKGVTIRKNCTHLKYWARIHVNGSNLDLGAYATAEEAIKAYATAAEEFHGAFKYP